MGRQIHARDRLLCENALETSPNTSLRRKPTADSRKGWGQLVPNSFQVWIHSKRGRAVGPSPPLFVPILESAMKKTGTVLQTFIRLLTPGLQASSKRIAQGMQAKQGSAFNGGKTSASFSRTRGPKGFGPGSDHLSSDVTTVTKGSAGGGLPTSGFATDRMSWSERCERYTSFVPLSHAGYLFLTNFVHRICFCQLIGRSCRTLRTVCHSCKYK